MVATLRSRTKDVSQSSHLQIRVNGRSTPVLVAVDASSFARGANLDLHAYMNARIL